MAKNGALLASLQKVYEANKAKEVEELHNAIVEVLNEQKPSVESVLYVLEIIRFTYMEAKYREIMGVVKLTDKPPIKPIEKDK